MAGMTGREGDDHLRWVPNVQVAESGALERALPDHDDRRDVAFSPHGIQTRSRHRNAAPSRALTDQARVMTISVPASESGKTASPDAPAYAFVPPSTANVDAPTPRGASPCRTMPPPASFRWQLQR